MLIHTPFKSYIHATSKGVLNCISIECLYTAGVVSVGIKNTENEAEGGSISSLKRNGRAC